MAVTHKELLDFNRFAEQKLSNGGIATLQALVDEWNSLREHERSVAAIRESVDQAAAGLGLPLHEACHEIRQKLGRRE